MIRELTHIFFLFFRTAIWAVIPLGILVLFLNFFPDFTTTANYWFWTVFLLLNTVAFYFLWKPVHWIISAVNILFEK